MCRRSMGAIRPARRSPIATATFVDFWIHSARAKRQRLKTSLRIAFYDPPNPPTHLLGLPPRHLSRARDFLLRPHDCRRIASALRQGLFLECSPMRLYRGRSSDIRLDGGMIVRGAPLHCVFQEASYPPHAIEIKMRRHAHPCPNRRFPDTNSKMATPVTYVQRKF